MFPDNHTTIVSQPLLSTPPRQPVRTIGITNGPSIVVVTDENKNRKYNIQQQYYSPTSVSTHCKKHSPQYRHRITYKLHTDNTTNHDDDDDNESIAPLTPRSDKYHQSLLNNTSTGLLFSSPTSSYSFDNSISNGISSKSSRYHNTNDDTNSIRQCTPLSPVPLPFSPTGSSCISNNSNNSNNQMKNYAEVDSNSKMLSSTTTSPTTTRTKTTTNSSTHSTKTKVSLSSSPKNSNNNTCILDVWANKRRIHSPGSNSSMNERDTDIDTIDNNLIIYDLAFLINKERQYYNLYPYQRSSELDYLAREHCQQMANNNTLYHSVTSSQQLQSKLSSVLVGENIQRGTSVCNIYRTMMCSSSSPDARTTDNDDGGCLMGTNTYNKTNASNILSKQFTEFGSAIYIGTTDYKMYCCQFFRKVNY